MICLGEVTHKFLHDAWHAQKGSLISPLALSWIGSHFISLKGRKTAVDMSKIENPEVARVFAGYPAPMRKKMVRLRQLVLDTALEIEGVNEVEETLKWGEPSYRGKGGSTIRMDWKDRTPDQYAMYFNCNTSLVATFKEVYGDVFTFEGNRAIVFGETDVLPVNELKHCVSLTLTYHRVKHLPLLGA